MTAQMVLEFDTPEWRQVRDHKLREWVQDESALAWFLDFCHVCELFDDVFDQRQADLESRCQPPRSSARS